MAAEPLRATARAKINLALHVTGRRPDGYHLIDSLIAFAGIGDGLEVAPADGLSLAVGGPLADGVPTGDGNLVIAAARALAEAAGISRPGAAIRLEKHLPAAAGLGGGSADAAAVLRLLARLWRTDADLSALAPGLGADVAMCLASVPVRARGIGEALSPVPPLPAMAVVLANPGVPVPTGPVFTALARTDNPPLPEPAWHDAESFLDWLAGTRNDLDAPATTIAPVIEKLTKALADSPGCRFARMTGSGASCFGLFADDREAENSAARLRETGLAPWAVATRLAAAGQAFRPSGAATV